MSKQQEQFNALTLEKKFQFLYHAVSINKDLLINWSETDFRQEADEAFVDVISGTFSFLEKLLFPTLKEEMIMDSEEAIDGVNEGIGMFIENMEDVTASSSIDRAYTSAQALSDLTQTIYDCFFENEQELYDYDVLNILTTSFFASNQLDFGNLSQEHMMSNVYKDDNDPDWNILPIENNFQENFYQFFNTVLQKIAN